MRGPCGVGEVVTIAIIDDDDSIRKALSRIMKTAGLNVNVFPSAQDFLACDQAPNVSCVVCDLRMPAVDGLQLQRMLADRMPYLAVVFITGHADVPSGVSAMKAGAVDFLEKPVKSEDLLEAIDRAVLRSRSAKLQAAELDELKLRYAELTPREREVFALVATGLLNKQIAAELGIAEKTIKQHRGIVMDKMAADSFADLVLMAERLGVRPSEKDFSRAKGRLPAFRLDPTRM